ncbi:MAG: polyribonucleotide nucleotidyltransferase [Bacteroidota bacterium]|nr:polyribonucleotide nucleotidyltransferase [Bacteroidota bacterium]MDP3145188.1 polyribonucleotide nucleotidyltransferase [Bacteroidota bacterium]MDP3557286.1 polyribonucleotide nucleotidyltransferase [Bacteroidota bacterium]
MSQIGTTHSFDIGDGRMISLETGKLAKQADGSVVLRFGDTMILATIVSNKDAKEGVDFLPLTVDYQEKYASTGRFPGGFFKREAKLSDYEVLISRIVDRALRPQFPEDYHADTQLMLSLISSDKENLPDALVGLAACAAVAVSDIPFNGAISEVRVAKIDGKLVINPTRSQLVGNTLEMIVAASATDIAMVEGEMSEVSEAEMLEAIKFAHEAIKIQIKGINDFAVKAGLKPKREYNHETNDADLKAKVMKETYDAVYAAAKKLDPNKNNRKVNFKAPLEEFKKQYTAEELKPIESLINKYYHEVEYVAVRRLAIDEKVRLDGRKTTDIRPIWAEVSYLPTPHGSAVFTRGETQSLTTVTLGTPLDKLRIDGAFKSGEDTFILHYNFPGFSTGEAKPNRGTSRREVGHGNLALRALRKVVPMDTGYTIRVVSDILESNGSSSMATVCAGSLALMDAGVKIAKPVSGIAMGLITDEKGNYAILSDILGDEDHLGDMDFKVCGTVDGITAVQMDLKVNGLPYEVMAKAMEQAKVGRLHIMNEMLKALDAPRADYKEHAPRFERIVIAGEFIGAIIGPGGKVIQEMQKATNTTIVITEDGKNGIVEIFGTNLTDVTAAKTRIKGIVTVPEVGDIYQAKVKTIMPYGAFVEIMPGKDGLLHISEYDWKRIDTLEGVLKEGDVIEVKYVGDDPKTKKIKLSRKALLPKPDGMVEKNEA